MRESAEKAMELRNTATCARCGLDPWERKNWAMPMHSCDYCKAVVCEACCIKQPNDEMYCLTCDFAVPLED